MTLSPVEFIEARIAEDEEDAAYALDRARVGETRGWQWLRTYGSTMHPTNPSSTMHIEGAPSPERVLAQCAAYRQILELHKDWPVLVESRPTFEGPTPALGDVNAMTFRMSQQLAWTTDQAYRERFGTEPPTSPIIRALASIWSDHPDYPFRDEEGDAS